MSDFYSQMRDLVASPLLETFKQGSIEFVRYVAPEPTDAWDPVPNSQASETAYSLNAAARGMPQKYVDGTTILESDIFVTASVNANISPAPSPGETVTIDGKPHLIVDFRPNPPSGTAVVWQFFLRA